MQFFGPVGQGNIHHHADELNNDLSQERGKSHQVSRPLIFFAHSLGGLVVKSVSMSSEKPVGQSTYTGIGAFQVISSRRI